MIEWAAQHGLEWLINEGTLPGIASEYPAQFGLYTLIVFALGALAGWLFRGSLSDNHQESRPKSVRQLKREKRARDAEQLRMRREMIARIVSMPRLRQFIMLTALRDGEFISDRSTMPQAMTLCSEGYLNAAGTNGTGNTVFTPPTWMVAIIESDETARSAIERAVEVYNEEE